MHGRIWISTFNGYTFRYSYIHDCLRPENLSPSSISTGEGYQRAPVHYNFNYVHRDRLQHPTSTSCMWTVHYNFNYLRRDPLRHPTSTSCTTSSFASRLYDAYQFFVRSYVTTPCLQFASSRKYIIPPRMFQSKWHLFPLTGFVAYAPPPHFAGPYTHVFQHTHILYDVTTFQRLCPTGGVVGITFFWRTRNLFWLFSKSIHFNYAFFSYVIWLDTYWALKPKMHILLHLNSVWIGQIMLCIIHL